MTFCKIAVNEMEESQIMPPESGFWIAPNQPQKSEKL